MKSKLLIFIILIATLFSVMVIPAMAAPKIVEITRPEGNEEVVTKEIFSIFGTCVYDETTISLEYYDKSAGEYLPLETTEGQTTFKVGSGKMFGKDIKLNKGKNEIRVIASAKELKDEKQYLTFTITYAEEKKKSNLFDKITDWLTKKD